MKKLTIALLIASALPALAVSVGINSSSVSVSGTGSYRPDGLPVASTGYRFSSVAPIDGPFVASHSGSAVMQVPAGPSPVTTFGRSSASQESSTGISQISAQGYVSSQAFSSSEELYFQNYSAIASASSVFDVLLQFSEPTSYHLVGSLGKQWWSQGVSLLSLSLLGSDPFLAFDLNTFIGFRGFDLSGTLEPGTYHLIALAGSESRGSRTWSESSWASFDFTMNFNSTELTEQVPEEGATWLLMGMGLIALFIGCRPIA